jgi:hypothetical protein
MTTFDEELEHQPTKKEWEVAMYQIAPLKSSRPLPYHPSFDSKDAAYTYVQMLNDGNRKLETGKVFKVVFNTNIDVEPLT